nr:receptor-like protein kinase 2 [Tanacetum cinerariifolium]
MGFSQVHKNLMDVDRVIDSGFNHEATVLYTWLHGSIPNWKLDTTPCNWTYIRCNSLGFVTEIDIQSVPLQVSLPYNLSSFPYLKKLAISDSNITGTIPDDIGNCPELLTGNIPNEIGKCKSLKNLVIFDNQLTGNIPVELGQLQNLEVIRAGGNKDLNGKIPDEIGNCGNLTVLGLADTKLSGLLPNSLGKLTKLQTLSIYTTMLSGEIPSEIGNCSELVEVYFELEEFMISNNNISGSIPVVISNVVSLKQLQLDTNQISGLIPADIGKLQNLEVFFAWDNQLEGSLPLSLGNCSNLQALDLSQNSLTGSIPSGLFQLQNLTKLLLISNDISGSIPKEIENCISLVRLRLGNNRITGEIPKEIVGLKSINFLDFSGNRLSGAVPDDISGCTELQMLDFSNNMLEGSLPNSLSSLSSLQVLDVSDNQFSGPIPASLGRLVSLNKLVLSKNAFSGSIPTSIGLCSSLQLLDLSSNKLTGEIPNELCNIDALEIALNLSCNRLSGPMPIQISALNKLSLIDMSYNMLDGNLSSLSHLGNLVSLNILHNNFNGFLPDTKLFRQLSDMDIVGNQGLCSFGKESCFLSNVGKTGNGKDEYRSRNTMRLRIVIAMLVLFTIAMMIMGIVAVLRGRKNMNKGDDESELGDSWLWQFTPFQKLNVSVDQILKCLVDANVIGKGYSGVVYRADMDNGESIAVKKLWPSMTVTGGCNQEKSVVRDSFSAEVKTLGIIRHKNIVRFLGCCWNQKTRLLMYDYMPNGSLAQGIAYLHHDCVPPIVHRDIKANNILIGLEYEPYIADFRLAKLVDDGDFARSSKTVAGSYGYIAPEYGYMMKITEKSDVYSYGVVILEVLTGKQPIDPTIPDGLHIVDWVRKQKVKPELLDQSLLSQPESDIEEMTQTLGIALLCVNSSPEERPTMKNVTTMLKEIKRDRDHDYLLKKIGVPAITSSFYSS